MISNQAYVHKLQHLLKERKNSEALVHSFFKSRRKLEAKKFARILAG